MNQANRLRESLGVEVSDPIVPEIQYRTMALEYATRSTVTTAEVVPTDVFLARAGAVYAFLKNGPVPVDSGDKAA